MQQAELDEDVRLRSVVAVGFGRRQRALQRPQGIVDLPLVHVDVGDERRDPVVVGGLLELDEIGERVEALAGVVERAAAAEREVGVGRVELEGAAVGGGGAGVVACALELASEAEVGVDEIAARRLGLGDLDRRAEGRRGVGAAAQACERDRAVELAVESIGAEARGLVEREERGLEVAAAELGEAESVVRVAGAVVDRDRLEEGVLRPLDVARFVEGIAKLDPGLDVGRLVAVQARGRSGNRMT